MKTVTTERYRTKLEGQQKMVDRRDYGDDVRYDGRTGGGSVREESGWWKEKCGVFFDKGQKFLEQNTDIYIDACMCG